MAANLPELSGGQLVVAALRAHGVEMAFSVAGESYLEVLDALYDAPEIRLVTCRQEGGAAFMAEAYGKLTGKPGVLLVTRGPGACNASIGVHTAHQDSTPMVVLVGQVARHQIDREAFQEVDFRKMYAPLAKWVTQIDMAERVPELLNQAFQVATSGRPGPVVVALPEDMLRERAAAAVVGPYRAVRAHPGAADLAEMRRLLGRAERPIMLVGGGGWTDQAAADIADFADGERSAGVLLVPPPGHRRQPSAVLCRRSRHRRRARRSSRGSRSADLVLAVGARIGEITSQSYTLLGIPDPGKVLIHVHPAAEELGRVFRPTLAIQSGMPRIRRRPRRARPDRRTRAGRAGGDECARRIRGRADAEPLARTAIAGARSRADHGVAARAPAGRRDRDLATPAISAAGRTAFCNTAAPDGSSGRPAARWATACRPRSRPSSSIPDRIVVGFCGDGGFMMTGQELATAQSEGVGPIILLFNNAMYGTIRMHQERRFPGRVVGTALKNPDFASLADAYGAFGAVVTRTEEFAPAFEMALKARRGAVIELRMDPEMITTRTTLAALRRQAEAAGA